MQCHEKKTDQCQVQTAVPVCNVVTSSLFFIDEETDNNDTWYFIKLISLRWSPVGQWADSIFSGTLSLSVALVSASSQTTDQTYLSFVFKKQVPLKFQQSCDLWCWIFIWLSLVKILQITISMNKHQNNTNMVAKM